MANLNVIKNKCQDWWSTRQNRTIALQAAYLAANNRYWQGIVSCDVPPDDGADATFDVTRAPTDQPVEPAWQDFYTGPNAMPNTAPMQAEIDVYQGPQGWGWQFVSRFTQLGLLYERVWNYGPETWREHDWTSSDQTVQQLSVGQVKKLGLVDEMAALEAPTVTPTPAFEQLKRFHLWGLFNWCYVLPVALLSGAIKGIRQAWTEWRETTRQLNG